MSALVPKRTRAGALQMSAFGDKADTHRVWIGFMRGASLREIKLRLSQLTGRSTWNRF